MQIFDDICGGGQLTPALDFRDNVCLHDITRCLATGKKYPYLKFSSWGGRPRPSHWDCHNDVSS